MPKYMDAYHQLRQMVIALQPGAPVRSVRDLMQELNLSQVTITRALQELKKEGLIVARVGEGTFRAGRGEEGAREIRALMLLPDYPSPFTAMLQAAFKRHFTQAGHTLKIEPYDSERPAISRSLLKSGFNSVLFLPNAGVPLEVINPALESGMAGVLLDTVAPQHLADSICADNQFGGALAADHLIRQGHRRVAMLLGQPPKFTSNLRESGFLRQFSLAGLPAPDILDCQTIAGENSAEKAGELIRQRIKQKSFDYTAIFCDSDLGALGLMGTCQSHGLRIPQDLAVVGFDNLPESGFFFPALSSIDQNLHGWSMEAEALLLRRLQEQHPSAPVQIMVPPRLVERTSSSAVRTAVTA